MTHAPRLRPLHTLVSLQSTEVERLHADVARQQALRERYRHNLARMADLCRDTATLPAASPLAALNNGDYRLALMHVAEQHRQQLALHEADMAASRQALHDATRRHEVLNRVLQRAQQAQRQVEVRRDQKHQDDLANQVWFRSQA